MKSDLTQQVAIVTGASSGIGEATAIALAQSGAKVAVAARRKERLDALVRTLGDAGAEVMAVTADVTDRQSVENLAAQTLSRFGKIDILVANAGIMPLAPMRQLHVDEWDQMLAVNVRGLLYSIAATLPTMLKQRSGHIVTVSSLASRRPFPGGVVYSATKFASRTIADGLRLELSASDNIRITDIEPGVVTTELLNTTTDEAALARFQNVWKDKTALSADDVARAIIYAVTQPPHVNVNEVLVRPTNQET